MLKHELLFLGQPFIPVILSFLRIPAKYAILVRITHHLDPQQLYSDNQPDRVLFVQVADGDTESFTRLLDRYQSNIFGLALAYLKNFHKAQDIVQDVFMVVWERRHDLSSMENPEGFLYTVARHKIISEFRKRHPEVLDRLEQMRADTGMSADRRFEDSQIYQLVQSAVEKLPLQQKKVFVLAKREGLSYDAIALQLGISRETVKVHMVKALSYLRSFMRNLDSLLITISLIIF